MELVCTRLGLRRAPVRYEGRDFNGIFDGLASRAYDAVISGTTITPEREKVALFSEPYLESGQSLVVNVERTPEVRSVEDLGGLVVGIQVGNTSDAVAQDLKRRGIVADIRYYPYGGIEGALDDLSAGRIGAFIKLLPVMRWFTRGRAELAVVQGPLTNESLGIAVAPDNVPLRDAVNGALADLRASGELDRLTARWLR
jgi:ABC-type amino acid transport substrate-binding protein